MNDHSQKDNKGLAETLALGEVGKHPEMAARAASYMDEQIALAKAQQEHIKSQQAQLEREAVLHDLHTENLKLQSHALRAQHQQLRSQRLHDRFRTIYQTVLSVIALVVLCAIVYALYSAATDQSVVVNQFQVPPAFVAQGNNGTAVASQFLDQLNILQASARSSQSALALQDAWSNNIRVQVPDVHVSLGDIRHSLHQWLGHEVQINGDVVEQGTQIALTVRGTGFAAKTFSGSPTDLQQMLTTAAEYVYGQAEPYQFASYLEENNEYAQAIQLVQAAYPSASTKEQPWLLNAWGNALAFLNQNVAAVSKYEQANHLDPHIWIVYGNLQDSQIALGQEEAAYQTGLRLEKTARRGSSFAARIAGLNYLATDYLHMDLPTEHHELLADEATHSGQGSQFNQDAPQDAEMLVRMHADKQALLTLQTSPGAGSNPYVLAETAFVQGLMALDRQDYAQAVAAFQTTDTLLTQHPDQQANFLTPPICYLAWPLGFLTKAHRPMRRLPRADTLWIAIASKATSLITVAIGPKHSRIIKPP